MSANLSGDDINHILGLIPHIEGGCYREIYREVQADGGRDLMTSIYYLIRANDPCAWHRIDTTEVWCYHAGSPFEGEIYIDGRTVEKVRLGSDLAAGEKPQVIVPAGAWRTARTVGDWSLFGCIVAPAFEWKGFEMAPAGWSPSPQHKAAYPNTYVG